tara:strand:+ start:1173 stop:1553 length:381 start_codon:yes stop_codon:yes gene_type:complete
LKQTSLEDAFLNFTNIQNVNNKSGPSYDLEKTEVDFESFRNFGNLDVNSEVNSGFKLFCIQFCGVFLKKWYSFKRDWRMWLIMVLPSLMISAFLVLGFQREYMVKDELSLSSLITGTTQTKANDMD